MAGFVYFIRGGESNIKLEDIQAAGLGSLVEEPYTAAQVSKGPDESPGVIVACDGCVPSHYVGFYDDKQTWRRTHRQDAGATRAGATRAGATRAGATLDDSSTLGAEASSLQPVWVGFWSSDPPKPKDLIRRRILPGHTVTLGDDEGWIIPIARGLAETSEGELPVGYMALPQITTIDENGRWMSGGVCLEYDPLWQLALRWWDCMTAAAGEEAKDAGEQPGEAAPVTAVFDFDGLHDGALLALATNYRVGKAEVAALGLFNTTTARAILDAVVDWPTLIEFLKKKQEALESGEPGG